MGRRQVFLKEELNAIGQRLQQTERSDVAGSPAVLHMSNNFALQPYAVGNCRQQHNECHDGLDEGHENEGTEAQRLSFSQVYRCSMTRRQGCPQCALISRDLVLGAAGLKMRVFYDCI